MGLRATSKAFLIAERPEVGREDSVASRFIPDDARRNLFATLQDPVGHEVRCCDPVGCSPSLAVNAGLLRCPKPR